MLVFVSPPQEEMVYAEFTESPGSFACVGQFFTFFVMYRLLLLLLPLLLRCTAVVDARAWFVTERALAGEGGGCCTGVVFSKQRQVRCVGLGALGKSLSLFAACHRERAQVGREEGHHRVARNASPPFSSRQLSCFCNDKV